METIWSLIDSWSIKYALRDLLWSSVQSKHRHTVLTESSVELRLGDCQEKKQLDKSWHIDALTSLLKRSSWQQCFSKNKLQQRMRKLNWRRRWKRQVQKIGLGHSLTHCHMTHKVYPLRECRYSMEMISWCFYTWLVPIIAK